MKKLFLTLILATVFGSTCGAASSIVIDNVQAKGVLDFSAEFYCTLNPGFVVAKSNEDYAILAAKRKDANGKDFMQQIRLTAVQKDKNVKLGYEAVKIINGENGKPVLENINEPGNERNTLATLKTVFNDHYCFGYVLSTEYKDNGFVIDLVDLDSSFRTAGIKPGDILLAVDGKAITKADEGLYNDKALESCFTGKETEFQILQAGEVKTFKLKPIFEPAMLR